MILSTLNTCFHKKSLTIGKILNSRSIYKRKSLFFFKFTELNSKNIIITWDLDKLTKWDPFPVNLRTQLRPPT